MQIQWNFNKNDEYYTPKYAVYPIMERLKKSSHILCPFDTTESNFVKVFEDNGFIVDCSHISMGVDFFDLDLKNGAWDYIISNPPYSLKTYVVEKLVDSGVPFAMLMNVQGLFDCKQRFELFKKVKPEILYLYPRVEYIKPYNVNSKTGVPFQSAYLCKSILKSSLEFDFVERDG